MSVLNATYDVNWGVPDQSGAICDSINPSNPGFLKTPWLPVCTNTTDKAYPGGNWTMWSGAPHVSGLRSATSYNESTFGKYTHPYATWSLEIAFPIRSGAAKDGGVLHGGLLSAADGVDMLEFDPIRGDAAYGLPRFWYIDFSRAEHPRAYSSSTQRADVFCPFNCSSKLAEYNASLTNPTAEQCQQAAKEFPTLLGADPFYGCYWEWAWQSVGSISSVDPHRICTNPLSGVSCNLHLQLLHPSAAALNIHHAIWCGSCMLLWHRGNEFMAPTHPAFRSCWPQNTATSP